MNNKKVSIIGGDLRQLSIARLLRENGYDVKFYGWNEENTSGFKVYESAEEVSAADVLIFSVPMCRGDYINAPYTEEEILLEDVINNIRGKKIVFGGMIPEIIKQRFEKTDITYCDYLEREEVAVKNALITAEGALEIALRETTETIHKSQCTVIGYGRIGKIVSRMFRNLGAKVSVVARRLEVRAEAETEGFEVGGMENLTDFCSRSDIVINTVPCVLLTEDVLDELNQKMLIIDLASKPGGVDFEYAREKGIKVIWATGLPGKVAHSSAGAVIYETISDVLVGLEVIS